MWVSISHITILLTVLSILSPTINGANILALLPSPSPSHLVIEMEVVRALAERDHNITVVSVLPIEATMKNSNIKYIDLKSGLTNMRETVHNISKAQGFLNRLSLLKIASTMSQTVAEILEDKQFLDLLHNNGNKFDLLLYGYIFSDFLFGVGAHFNCPIALIWPNLPLGSILDLIGNPNSVSYVPTSMAGVLTSDNKIDFKFRLINLFTTVIERIVKKLTESVLKNIYDKHFPADRYPDYATAKQRVCLILFCHHFSERPVRPLVPGLVEIGGIQLNEQPNELPANIAKILDNANKHGVIYFSFGTNVRDEHLEPNTLQFIFNVLSKLPQQVLWKCDNITNVPGKSANIFYKTWLPQADILAHRNTRLFFTHGGKGGITEAQYYGVPMVGVPIFGDQPMNLAEVKRNGYGVVIEDVHSMSEDDVQTAVNDVLSNPKYKLAVQHFSQLYRDRPMSARDTAVYWLEYVIRHKGAPHMQSPLKYLSTVEKYNLDVMLFLAALVVGAILFLKLTFMVLRKLVRRGGARKLKTN